MSPKVTDFVLKSTKGQLHKVTYGKVKYINYTFGKVKNIGYHVERSKISHNKRKDQVCRLTGTKGQIHQVIYRKVKNMG